MCKAVTLFVLMDRYRFWQRSRKSRGFTLIENAIILILIGVLATIAAPSMTQMLAKIELNKSVVSVQTSFSSAQRQAIRVQSGCEVGILENRDPNNDDKRLSPSIVYSECLPVKDSPLSEETIVATNLQSLPEENGDGTLVNPNSTSKVVQEAYEWCVKHESHNHEYWDDVCLSFQEQPALKFAQMFYRPDGAVKFGIHSQSSAPTDSSGKMVFYHEGDSKKKPRCLVISRRLGLMRVGQYSGSLDPTEMTEKGACTSEDWDKQTL